MALANRISATLSQEQSDAVEAAVASIITNLPFLVDLTDGERDSLHYLKSTNHGFVLNTLKLAQTNPGFLPRDFSVPEFEKDTVLFDSLFSIKQSIASLLQRITDTTNLAGSEAYAEALAVYDYAVAGNVGTQGIEPYVDEMARRFARKAKATSTASQAKAAK